MNLPTKLADPTPGWLSAALSERCPGTAVESVEVESLLSIRHHCTLSGLAFCAIVRSAYRPPSGKPA
jgi:hypothetical protein